ncbi:MAG: hypothetical protein BWY21_01968 [Parcubacteria group bacterium ADurb.Bin216]|nr:MAG: hypothetical protein BWY21_01968 [Parcubacteria group bacterium ADurb.Bin216]
MGVTKIDYLNAIGASAQIGTSIPTAPYIYYGTSPNDVDSVTWRGGELYYHSGQNRLYVQTATSGTTPVWKRMSDTYATTTTTSTTTTSTSTSTSSSTSTSTSTSSTTTH